MHPKKGRSKTSLIKAKKLVFELESLDLSLIFQLWKVGLVKRFQKRDRHQKTLLRCLNPTYNTQNAPFSWKLDKTKWSITIRRQRENRNWKMNKWYQVFSMLKHVLVDFNTADTICFSWKQCRSVFLLTYLHHGKMR